MRIWIAIGIDPRNRTIDRPGFCRHRQIELDLTFGHPAVIVQERIIRLDSGRVASDERLAKFVDRLDRPGWAFLGEPHPRLDHDPEVDVEPGLALLGRPGDRDSLIDLVDPEPGPSDQ